jgi:hypothetical protein
LILHPDFGVAAVSGIGESNAIEEGKGYKTFVAESNAMFVDDSMVGENDVSRSLCSDCARHRHPWHQSEHQALHKTVSVPRIVHRRRRRVNQWAHIRKFTVALAQIIPKIFWNG